jgi:hypothetical protein
VWWKKRLTTGTLRTPRRTTLLHELLDLGRFLKNARLASLGLNKSLDRLSDFVCDGGPLNAGKHLKLLMEFIVETNSCDLLRQGTDSSVSFLDVDRP